MICLLILTVFWSTFLGMDASIPKNVDTEYKILTQKKIYFLIYCLQDFFNFCHCVWKVWFCPYLLRSLTKIVLKFLAHRGFETLLLGGISIIFTRLFYKKPLLDFD